MERLDSDDSIDIPDDDVNSKDIFKECMDEHFCVVDAMADLTDPKARE